MAEILKLYKNMGETPLECILRFKDANPEYEQEKMAYLGRLDPMAEGLLLVLVGSGSKEEYFALDKAYEFEVMWGFETDTYDVMGKVVSLGKMPRDLEKRMDSIMDHILQKKTQVYPVFSSKSFRGNFMAVREKDISEIKRPERGIKIFSIDHVHTRLVSAGEILEDITKRISLVSGDFRQSEIIKIWQEHLKDKQDQKFLISKFSADVSSGTYIRSLANEMGKKAGTCAIAYSIKRMRVGEFRI